MSAPEEKPSVARGDHDAAVNTAADRNRERLEQRGIRTQDVGDALAWARERPDATDQR